MKNSAVIYNEPIELLDKPTNSGSKSTVINGFRLQLIERIFPSHSTVPLIVISISYKHGRQQDNPAGGGQLGSYDGLVALAVSGRSPTEQTPGVSPQHCVVASASRTTGPQRKPSLSTTAAAQVGVNITPR